MTLNLPAAEQMIQAQIAALETEINATAEQVKAGVQRHALLTNELAKWRATLEPSPEPVPETDDADSHANHEARQSDH